MEARPRETEGVTLVLIVVIVLNLISSHRLAKSLVVSRTDLSVDATACVAKGYRFSDYCLQVDFLQLKVVSRRHIMAITHQVTKRDLSPDLNGQARRLLSKQTIKKIEDYVSFSKNPSYTYFCSQQYVCYLRELSYFLIN